MTKRSLSTAAAGLVLGAAVSLLGTTGTAEAAPTGASAYATTVQAHSNLRDAPNTSSRIWGTTTKVTEAGVECYTRGQRVTAGGYTTDVWYFGTVIDYDIGHIYSNVWMWGGNVNVGADPAPGIPRC
ncbi:hypothetical protein [Streptomyces chryseus]|uniref:SH3 domain-containing protein n=1 Tax=Streptomyces chryseus TaxID=68186 RepID=A0ABQ3E4U3_9ACTN|nr:hypothetical protein [Streptomyces chryseus]GGX37470.1 hypothetical protein GCM10010353_61020 [Streptomyces chryseus]GHB26081.1 hypothetical protein GCM10010346_57150 [Streptomyces chryseus]